MPSPAFGLVCCLCRNLIPRASEVYGLDREWQRRFPRMIGTLACAECAVSSNRWSCSAPGGALVDGHLSASNPAGCIDSWSHIADHGTQLGMVLAYLSSGLVQGAEDYLRWVVGRPNADRATAQQIRDALDRWDATA